MANPVDRCIALLRSQDDSLLARVVLQINMNRCIVAVISYIHIAAKRGPRARALGDVATALVEYIDVSLQM